MTYEEKAAIINLLEQSKGDDLYRAELAFRGQNLDETYGHSGKSKRQILEEYRAHNSRIESLIRAVNNA